MNIVLDTNIYIAIALQGEFAEDIIKLITINSDITVITSKEIFSELQQKLEEKFDWLKEDIDLFITKMRKISKTVKATEKVNIIDRDPEDNKILECALAGEADLIITSDQDLIKLKKFRGIGIIHPKTLSWIFPKYFRKTRTN